MDKMGVRTCWLCGRNGMGDPLDRHHIFGGAYRNKSERLGMVVDLCHGSCHIFGPEAAHANQETARRLKAFGQKKAMREQGWSVQEFIWEFGKNWIMDEPQERADDSDFEVLDGECPF